MSHSLFDKNDPCLSLNQGCFIAYYFLQSLWADRSNALNDDERSDFLSSVEIMYASGYQPSLFLGFSVFFSPDKKFTPPARLTVSEVYENIMAQFKYFHMTGYPCHNGLELLIDIRLNPEAHSKELQFLKEVIERSYSDNQRVL